MIAARLVFVGLAASFTQYICNVSVPDKRSCVRFFHHSAKHVT
jgi:hypothetical protein